MDFGQNILAQQIECIASVCVYFHGGKETYMIYIVVVESSAGRRC